MGFKTFVILSALLFASSLAFDFPEYPEVVNGDSAQSDEILKDIDDNLPFHPEDHHDFHDEHHHDEHHHDEHHHDFHHHHGEDLHDEHYHNESDIHFDDHHTEFDKHFDEEIDSGDFSDPKLDHGVDGMGPGQEINQDLNSDSSLSPVDAPAPGGDVTQDSATAPAGVTNQDETTAQVGGTNPVPEANTNDGTSSDENTSMSGDESTSQAGPECTNDDFASFKTSLRTTLEGRTDRGRWPARFLFLAFHDCGTGRCDGSIQFEQSRFENMKLGVVLGVLDTARAPTCVSLADAIKIALSVGMEMSGGPTVNCPLGTQDATSAEPAGRLPSPNDSLDVLISKLTRVGGITVREALAGNFGGHSYGGRNVNPSSGNPRVLFDNTPTRLDTTFIRSVLDGNSNAFLSGRVMADAHRAILEEWKDNLNLLRTEFGSFLNKLCSAGSTSAQVA